MLEKLEAAVRLAPWDHELRLVYADCLEENGQLDAAREQRGAASKKRRPKGQAQDRRLTCATTDSSAVHRKLYRGRLRACSYCPLHEGCNARRRPKHTSWKKSRKHRWRAK
jgi:uncharacterized protein (TIGR02996 family)